MALVMYGLIAAVPLGRAATDGRQPVVYPMPDWPRAAAAAVGMDGAKLAEARDYALRGEGSGYITRHGRLVMAWGDPRQLYDLKSSTKSFGSVALGLAVKDGKLRLEDKAADRHPEFGTPPPTNARTGWLEKITLLDLASQTAGFEKPGGYTRLLFEPGTQWDYSDSGPNWLAECITLAYARDLDEWMFERVFKPLGMRRSDLKWRKNSYRPAQIEGIARREFGAGIHANVDALARLGYLMLREGQWNGKEILTREYVRFASRTPPGHETLPVLHPESYGRASSHYGLLWWNNGDETLEGAPLDAYWSWGLYDSLILVVPSLDIVVARAGKSWQRDAGEEHYEVLKPFFVPIVEAVKVGRLKPSGLSTAPTCGFLPSPVIREIRWAPADTVLRKAKGSDNWPITSGDDGWLYTAYGDGWGFAPLVKEKLSLGLARVRGDPQQFLGENLRAPSLEQKGDGARGKKASGLLMVDGVLYLWARNAGNSQLAWSADRGAMWTWADWTLTTSFGHPAPLNFGPNYAGARDDFVYLYSHDSESAYERADRMVLARVPKDRLRQLAAYEFFECLDAQGEPVWTSDIARRGAVLDSPGRCYRSSVSYNSGLSRYLWVQTGLGADTRFAGGLSIYDAPEPWGPWTSVFATDAWDIGPGESASLPTPWMSPDGRTVHLVFSGNDCFSVRRGTLVVDE